MDFIYFFNKKKRFFCVCFVIILGVILTQFVILNNEEPDGIVQEKDYVDMLNISPGKDSSEINISWYCKGNEELSCGIYFAQHNEFDSDDFWNSAKYVKGTCGDAEDLWKWNKVTLTGLEGDTEYRYCLVNAGKIGEKKYSFKTGKKDGFSFAVVGDPQITDGKQDLLSEKFSIECSVRSAWRETITAIRYKRTNLGLLISVGDQVNSTRKSFFEEYRELLNDPIFSSVPFAPTVGNHDRNQAFSFHFHLPNEQIFSPIKNSQNLEEENYQDIESKGNYWYRYGEVLFVVLNNSAYPDNVDMARMYIERFESTIKQAIDQNTVNGEPNYKWIFVTCHKSILSAAAHATDKDIQYYSEAGFDKLMEKYGVDVVFSGHDHIYSRGSISRKKGEKCVYISFNTATGIKYYEQTSPENTNESIEVQIQEKKPEFTVVDVGEDCVDIETYNTDDLENSIDKVTIKKQSKEKRITLLHTNDVHGKYVTSQKSIGLGKISSYKRKIDHSLLIDCGDIYTGTNKSQKYKMISAMNLAQYDVAVVGNHDFDGGVKQLLSLSKHAKFPVLGANVNAFSAKENSIIKEVNGVKVGFFGILSPNTLTVEQKNEILNHTGFSELVNLCKQEISILRKNGAQIIVGLMHVGDDESQKINVSNLAKKLSNTGLDIILDGHSHVVVNKCVSGVWIFQAGALGEYLGKVDILYSENGIKNITGSVIRADEAYISSEKKISRYITKSSSKTDVSRKLGKLGIQLWAKSPEVEECEISETNLGNFVTDAMAFSAKKDLAGSKYSDLPIVAIQNGGGLEGKIGVGEVSKGQIDSLLPYNDYLIYKLVTPAQLYNILENGFGKIESQSVSTGELYGVSGRFPQISGMKVRVDIGEKGTCFDTEGNPVTYGNRVKEIALVKSNVKKILNRQDRTTQILLVVNEYINGGDGYTEIKKSQTIKVGREQTEVVADYFIQKSKKKNFQKKYSVNSKRIFFDGIYQERKYFAKVYIYNSSGEKFSERVINYKVDGRNMQGRTLNNGCLVIPELLNGPHEILFADGKSVLVNNLSGAGTSKKSEIELVE